MIDLRNISKSFGADAVALCDVSFKVNENEFFTLLGPSGCGKTTLLRIIAGFEFADRGAVLLDDADISALAPEKRPVNTVFQNYALFPHMTVLQNVAFGMEMRGIKRADAESQAHEMLQSVMLDEFAARHPSQLSGGQQQRVALARALANKPRVLLLDEPLSALDFKLRKTMRLELKKLQRDTGITFIFVTHDQEEALAMSDRVAVMHAGSMCQIGAPSEIYEFPANRFVADFIGETNFLVGEATSSDGVTCITLRDGSTIMTASAVNSSSGQVAAAIRPERMRLHAADTAAENSILGNIDEIIYQGSTTRYELLLTSGDRVAVLEANSHNEKARFMRGKNARVQLLRESLWVLPE